MFSSVQIEGNLIAPDLATAIATPDLKGQQAPDFGLKKSDKLEDEIAYIWGEAKDQWSIFQRRLARLDADDPATSLTREYWALPLLKLLGYAPVYQPKADIVDDQTYAISHRAGVLGQGNGEWGIGNSEHSTPKTGNGELGIGNSEHSTPKTGNGELGVGNSENPTPKTGNGALGIGNSENPTPHCVLPTPKIGNGELGIGNSEHSTPHSLLPTPSNTPPIHIIGCRVKLEQKPPSGTPRLSAHALVQEYLNRTEHLWAIATNGLRWRLLRDSSLMTRLTYVEFDLEQMLNGEDFAAFGVFYRLFHRTRLPAGMEDCDACLLEF
jgi:hypothetical protein